MVWMRWSTLGDLRRKYPSSIFPSSHVHSTLSVQALRSIQSLQSSHYFIPIPLENRMAQRDPSLLLLRIYSTTFEILDSCPSFSNHPCQTCYWWFLNILLLKDIDSSCISINSANSSLEILECQFDTNGDLETFVSEDEGSVSSGEIWGSHFDYLRIEKVKENWRREWVWGRSKDLVVAAFEGESSVALKSFFLSLSLSFGRSLFLMNLSYEAKNIEDSDLNLVWILSRKLLARGFCSRLSCFELLPNLRY